MCINYMCMYIYVNIINTNINRLYMTNIDILNGYYKQNIYTFLSPHSPSWIFCCCHDAFWGRFWNRTSVSGSIRLSEDSHLSQQPTWCQTAPPLPIFLCSCGLCSDVISHWCSRKHICVLTQTFVLSPSCCPGSLPVPKRPHFFYLLVWMSID